MTLWDVEVWTVDGPNNESRVEAKHVGVILQSRCAAAQGFSHELMIRCKNLPYDIMDSVYVNGLEFIASRGVSVVGTSFRGVKIKWQQWRITPHGQTDQAVQRLATGEATAEAGAVGVSPAPRTVH